MGTYVIDGVEYPRVTDLLPVTNFAPWAAAVVAREALTRPLRYEAFHEERMRYYTERRREPLPEDEAQARADEDTFRYLRGAAFRVRDIAGLVGSCVHDLARRYEEGWMADEDTLRLVDWYTDRCRRKDPDYDPQTVWRKFEAFKGWWDSVQPVPLMRETVVYDPDVGYAGTVDMIAEIDGETVLVDYKTSNGVWDSYALQAAAYAKAPAVWADEKRCPKPDVRRAVILHINDDGCVEHEVLDVEMAYKAFLASFELWRLMRARNYLS